MWKNNLKFNKDFYIEISFWVAIVFASLYFDKSFEQKTILNNIVWILAVILLLFDALQLVCLKRYKVKTMSEELKTIKELADELGVSKQAIQYHIKSLTNKNRQTNDKGVTVLSAIEQEFIRGKVDKQTNKKNRILINIC